MNVGRTPSLRTPANPKLRKLLATTVPPHHTTLCLRDALMKPPTESAVDAAISLLMQSINEQNGKSFRTE